MAISKKELVANGVRWVEAAKRESLRERGVGAIFLFFNLDDPVGSAVCLGTVNREAVKAACEGILKKLGSGRVIINPFERN